MNDSYSTRKGKKCVLYLRVSLERQTEGYSLEGQKRYLKDWAEFEGMTVVDTYVDAGKSGKSISGRDEFQRMLNDVSTKVIDIDYVIVFKLSRFGRNAKDVLNSLSHLQRYGVNLICKEDGLDSSTSMGRMMITILGAVAEMERENILAQSMLGREEKAKQGGWNGGIAPYGYTLQNGKLEIEEEEAKVVSLIFDKFVNEGMGYSTIVRYLNGLGVPRPTTKTSNNRPFTDWSTQQVRLILRNPVYTGRVTYGRTRQKKVEGTDNEFRRARSKDFIVSSEISHTPIIDDELFEKAQLRCQKTAASSPKIGRAPKHLLSGILRCPQCGSAMIAEHSGWQNRGGEKKEVLNYQCGHHAGARGGQCKKNAIRADWVETEVIEYTKQLIQNPQFAADIQAQIGQQSDGAELDAEIEGYRKRLKKLEVSKANLERDIDNIVDGDRNAERKRKDMNVRLDKLYDEIYELENQISSREQKKLAIKQNMLTLETVHNMLGVFDKMFDVMDAADKRKVMETLVAEVQLHPKATWKEGQNPIKSITYTFPIHPEVLKTFGCNCKNVVTGTPAGTPLQGAVYEISDPRSNKVVEYITTDARGIAASRPLPLGRYKIKEVTAPAYWQLSGKTFDETLEYSGQIIKVSDYDKPSNLGVTITKRGNAEVLAGSQMRYDFTVANTSNVPLENYYWHDRIPTDAARATIFTTGTYSARLNYRILYKTNYTTAYQVLASNLITSSNYSFSLNAIPTQAGEYVTDVYFDFGKVPVGFQSVANPTLTVQVLGAVANGYQIVNRADVGGKYQGTWQTAQATWVTIVRKLTNTVVPTLPKTGY